MRVPGRALKGGRDVPVLVPKVTLVEGNTMAFQKLTNRKEIATRNK
jgi:hypothetical protein